MEKNRTATTSPQPQPLRHTQPQSQRRTQPRQILDPEAGIATAEFSIVTLAAVGFAGLLVTILSGGQVKGMLMGLISKALGS